MNIKEKLTLPSWMKKAGPALAVAAVFGVAGYFITPRNAESALRQSERNLGDAQRRLKQAVASQKKLEKQLSRSGEELAVAVERAATVAKVAEAQKAKLSAAEKFIVQLSAKLDQAKVANVPLLNSLAEAKKVAAGHKADVEKARTEAKNLTTKLSAAQVEKQKLDKANSALQADRTRLTASLASQKQASAELKRFLASLGLGEETPGRSIPATAQTPSEMPITTGELFRLMGYPSLTLEYSNYVEMKWDGRHTVRATDGLVTTIDGNAASRTALASAAVVRSSASAAPGQWRIRRGQKVYYADLVAMFGRPDQVAGSGGQFQACWSVGAWARRVSATVVDGVVTKFAGRPADGAVCCELARHRIGAYKSAGRAVQANAAAARAAYNRAVSVVGGRLAARADLRARDDGVKLVRWNMAPLDSVGTWVGPANASAGSATVRAWVDCTWAAMDGATTDERRYVVVTLFGKNQQIASAECAIFASRD